jgi:hypothetical protein
MTVLSWLQDTFGSKSSQSPKPDTDANIDETCAQINRTRRARGLLYRDIERTVPGGLEAFRRGDFPILDAMKKDKT